VSATAPNPHRHDIQLTNGCDTGTATNSYEQQQARTNSPALILLLPVLIVPEFQTQPWLSGESL